MRWVSFFLGAAIAATAACEMEPRPAASSENAQAAIRALSTQWLEAARRQDAAAIAALFADDGRLLWTGNDPVVGPVAIQRAIEADIAANPMQSVDWSADRIDVAESGDVAVELGTYENKRRGIDGTAGTERGHYATLYRNIGGEWKIVADTGTLLPPDRAADEPVVTRGITDRTAAFEAAWNAHDAAAIAEFYAPDGDLLVHDGPLHSGRDAVRASAVELFSDVPADCRIDIDVERVRLLRHGLATADATATYAACELEPEGGTYIWEQRDGVWEVTLLRVFQAARAPSATDARR